MVVGILLLVATNFYLFSFILKAYLHVKITFFLRCFEIERCYRESHDLDS